MRIRPTPRRLVGALLTATLMPFALSCAHPTSRAPVAPVAGSPVQLNIPSGADANAITSNGSVQRLTAVTRLEGILLQDTSDSIRLGAATAWLANGNRIAGLRQAAVRKTAEVALARKPESSSGNGLLVVVGVAAVLLVVLIVLSVKSTKISVPRPASMLQ